MKKERVSHKTQLTAVYIPSEKEGGYSAFIQEIPGVNSQGETLAKARKNLMEALELILDARHQIAEAKIRNKNVTREYIPIAI